MRPSPMTPHLTRRRALALSAAAGLGAVVRAPTDGWAAPAARTSSFGLRVPADAFAGRGRTTPVLRAPRRFDLLGLRGRGVARAGLEVRVRPLGGSWSPWVAFGMGLDHAPDRTARTAAVHTDPVWAGGADELQLRARRRPGAVRVHFVAVPPGVRTPAHPRGGPTASAAQAGGAPPIIPRAAWGADAVPPRDLPSYGEVQMAFVHHTVSANTYGPADSAGIVLAIAKYHRDANGWNDIGYNLLVDQYGQVFEGRAGGVEAAVIGAQAQGWNSRSTGIATLGTFEAVSFPEAGMEALARVIAWKLSLHAVPVLGTVQLRSPGGAQNRYPSGTDVLFQRVSGHRDGCSTSCPGAALYGQLDDLRARAARLAPSLPSIGAPKLTAVAGTGEAAYGEEAVFTGTLLDGTGVPLAGVPVQLQKQGSAAFVTVGRTTTGSDGSWVARVPWRRSGTVRARAVPPGAGQAVRSAALTVAVRPLLEVGRAPSRVRAGGSIRIRGRVRPVGPVRVKVERQGKDGRWRQVADVRMPVKGSRFSKAIPLRAPGLYRLTPRTGSGRGAFEARQIVVRAVRRASDVRAARDVRGDAGSGGAATPGAPGPGGAAAG